MSEKNSPEMKKGMRVKRGIGSFFATLWFALISAVIIFPVFSGFLASFRPGRELIRRGLSINLDFKTMSLYNYQ